MEAKERSLNEVFGGGPQKLVVPFFQRRYVWDEENWKELLESIEENNTIKTFLGSVIIKWGKKREPSEASIIDGQQRLTTISLLTKAIYDEFDDVTRKNVESIIQNVLFYKKNATDPMEKSETKIEHSRVDYNAYNYIIKNGIFDGTPVDEEEIKTSCPGQIGRCYLYYRKVLKNKNKQEIRNIFDTMYDDQNKMLVRIVLDENDVNEQSIFDTINRAGTKLSTADIIKNNLFKGFLDSCGDDEKRINEVYRLYDEKWDKIFYSESGKNEWDAIRYFGNVSKNNLEFLLYCVACIKWAKADTKDFSGHLDSVFAGETASYGFDEYKNLVEDIYEYAVIFSQRILSLSLIMSDKKGSAREKEYFSYDEHVRRLLLILEIFGVQMFYPFVLKILKDAGNDLNDEDLIYQSRRLETFVVRRRIIGSSVSDYSSKCNMILNKGVETLFLSSGDAEISINDAEIRAALTNMNGEAAKMILFWIELSRKTKNSDIDGLTYTYTLEHIMPQKWKENWGVPEDQMDNRQQHINDLGNLTLLKNSLNIKVRNADFKTKIEGIPDEGRKKGKEGYKGNIALEITEEIVDLYRNGNTVWNETSIDARRNKLADEIMALWSLE